MLQLSGHPPPKNFPKPIKQEPNLIHPANKTDLQNLDLDLTSNPNMDISTFVKETKAKSDLENMVKKFAYDRTM
jgi:hypothetical protein